MVLNAHVRQLTVSLYCVVLELAPLRGEKKKEEMTEGRTSAGQVK